MPTDSGMSLEVSSSSRGEGGEVEEEGTVSPVILSYTGSPPAFLPEPVGGHLPVPEPVGGCCRSGMNGMMY